MPGIRSDRSHFVCVDSSSVYARDCDLQSGRDPPLYCGGAARSGDTTASLHHRGAPGREQECPGALALTLELSNGFHSAGAARAAGRAQASGIRRGCQAKLAQSARASERKRRVLRKLPLGPQLMHRAPCRGRTPCVALPRQLGQRRSRQAARLWTHSPPARSHVSGTSMRAQSGLCRCCWTGRSSHKMPSSSTSLLKRLLRPRHTRHDHSDLGCAHSTK